MEKEKKQLGVAFIVVLVAIVMVSAIGIIAMSDKPVVLQGQIEATEIRISGKLPGRIDTFLVREGQYVKMGDTLVVINSRAPASPSPRSSSGCSRPQADDPGNSEHCPWRGLRFSPEAPRRRNPSCQGGRRPTSTCPSPRRFRL